MAAASLPTQGLVMFGGGHCGAATGYCCRHVDIVYNGISNTWTVYPGGLSQGRYNLAGASLPSQGLVFFVGGEGGLRVVDVYNVNTNLWAALATGLSDNRNGVADRSLFAVPGTCVFCWWFQRPEMDKPQA